MTEKWLPVAGFEGSYEVSDAGQVRSVDRLRRSGRGGLKMRRGRVLCQSDNGNGYLTVNLSRDGRSRSHYVHRLVLMAFIGPCPNGMECCHRNSVRGDNSLNNLRWGTRAENSFDSVKRGTCRACLYTVRGEDVHTAKLSKKDVMEIWALKGVVSQTELGRRYNVSQRTVSSIHRRRSWVHLLPP